MLQRILKGRITFTPVSDSLGLGQTGYDFEAPTRFDKLFTGIATPTPKDLDPSDLSGTEDIGVEDTFEGDYGRLLDRVFENAGKGWRARGDLSKVAA